MDKVRAKIILSACLLAAILAFLIVLLIGEYNKHTCVKYKYGYVYRGAGEYIYNRTCECWDIKDSIKTK